MNIKEERVAVISDFHVGKHQNSEKWHQITLNFIEHFKTILKKDNIKDIIICGDVNNDREEICVQSLDVLNRMFSILSDFNIIVIVGNHDAYYKYRSDVNSLSLFSGWKNITIVDDILEYDIFGKKLVFCPWSSDLNKVPKCDYLFGHFEINGFNLSKVKTCINGIDSSSVLKKSPMTISGHFHLRDDRKYKDGRILYIGSPYELDWGDCGTEPRGFYYLDIPTGKYEFVENKISPRHKKIRMSEITSAHKVTEDIKKEFKGNFVNFIIDQNIKNFDKLDVFISSLEQFKALSLKVENILEDRVMLEDSQYEFTAVDIKSSINEFIKMSDYENKDTVLTETYELYEKCNKESA